MDRNEPTDRRGADEHDTGPHDTDERGADLEHLLSRDRILTLAGSRSFDRGLDYVDVGRISHVADIDSGIRATVQGTSRYNAAIRAVDGDLAYACDCPVGVEGRFCKHLVALGLTWLDDDDDEDDEGTADDGPSARASKAPPPSKTPSSKAPSSRRPMNLKDARPVLLEMDRETLVEMLITHAEQDGALRDRLLVRAATATADGSEVALIRRAIDRACRVRGHVPYAQAFDYVRGIHEAVDLIDDLLRSGLAVSTIDLTEHALRKVERAIQSVDDSDGGLGEVLRRLQGLHLAACSKASPDPVELAGRLFEWELHGDWDVFRGAAALYADVLGDAGLAEYRDRGEREWSKVPAIGPDTRIGDKAHDGRFAITYIMETLAGLSGDIDELIEVRRRDLSLAYHYLQVAQVCAGAGRDDEALEWAERGIQAFPVRTDGRLREFLAEQYHLRSRHAEAMMLIWTEFTESPTLDHYRLLRAHAERSGTGHEWRQRALDHTRTVAADAVRDARERPQAIHRWIAPPDGSALVECLLADGEVETAWREAQDLGCRRALWLQLAHGREDEHPADAVPIYQREVELLVNQKQNEAYRVAVALVVRIRQLLQRLERDAESREYLWALRAAHARKRNFMTLLERAMRLDHPR